MNESIKDRWTSALRQGDYAQGIGGLRRGDAYCPFGVLCDLHRNEVRDAEWEAYYLFNEGTSYKYYFDAQRPPLEVLFWAGIGDTRVVTSIIGMNDIESKTFNQIADWIDEKL